MNQYNQHMRFLLILPTYNEAANIIQMLESLKNVKRALPASLTILIVDDNSPDGTGQLVQTYAQSNDSVHLLKRPGKLGLASAYQAGFDYAQAHGFDVAMQMDADFSHPLDGLARHMELMDKHDLVIGSRYVRGGRIMHWGPWRRFLSYAGNLYSRLILNLPIRDLTGGFNSYRVEALRRLQYQNLTPHGYAFQIELKYRMLRLGMRWVEFPITFVDRRLGKSKISSWQGPMALWQVLCWRLRR